MLGLLAWFSWDRVGSLLDLTRSFAATLRGVFDTLGPAGPVLVVLLVVAQVVFPPIPGPIVTLTVGAVYGPLWGFLLVWLGSVIGYGLAFQISRRYGRAKVAALELKNPRLARLGAFMDRRGAEAVFLLRLTPLSVSFDVLAYLAGLTRVRFRDFMLAAALGMVPSLFILILAGDTLGSEEGGLRHLLDPRFLAVVVAVAVTFLGLLAFYRRRIERAETLPIPVPVASSATPAAPGAAPPPAPAVEEKTQGNP